jgi:hypothetical protein
VISSRFWAAQLLRGPLLHAHIRRRAEILAQERLALRRSVRMLAPERITIKGRPADDE